MNLLKHFFPPSIQDIYAPNLLSLKPVFFSVYLLLTSLSSDP